MIRSLICLLLLASPCLAHVDHDVVTAIQTMFVNPTHTSRMGSHLRWSAPGTWVGGTVPGADAKVLIPFGSVVDFDGDTARLNWIRVQGRLGISGGDGKVLPPMTISVESLIVDETGELAVGESFQRVVNPITFLFLDRGDIDTAWDTLMLSRGIITLGRFAVHAELVTPKSFTSAALGATSITLQSPVSGWKPGDRLLLPGTALQQGGYAPVLDDDLVTIQSINGQTVTLTSPLRFSHLSTPQRPMPVANLTRRVTFRSENQAAIQRRAHFMVMWAGVYENFAVEGLGRTNKAITVSDPPNLSNVRGRYQMHAHRLGNRRGVDPVVTVRNVVTRDGPGWAFVCHSSNCDFDNNVGFNEVGSLFTAETGDEIGIFRNNLAVRAKGFTAYISPPIPDTSRGVSDFAFSGFCYWQHGGFPMESNIGTGCSAGGIMVMGAPFRLPGGPVVVYPTANLIPPLASWKGSTSIPPFEAPTNITNNVIFGSLDGVSMWAMGAIGARSNAIALGKFNGNYAEVGRTPMLLGYSNWQELRGNILRGTNKYTQTAISNTGVNSGFVYADNDIRGMNVGIHDPTTYENEVIGNTFQTLTGLYLMNTYQSPGRTIVIRDNVMVPLPPDGLALASTRTGYTYPYQAFQVDQNFQQKLVTFTWKMVFTSLYGGSDQYGWTQFFNNPNYPDVYGDFIRTPSQRLYMKEYDPAMSTASMSTLPAVVKTRPNGTPRTVGDLRTELGLYLGNVVMPADLATDPLYVGMVSNSDRVQLPKLTPNPNSQFYVTTNTCGDGFTLKVKDAAGVLRTFGPLSLSLGWNFPIVGIDGYARGVPVYCDPAAAPSGW